MMNFITAFFLSIHRSILDPAFYQEVLSFRKRRVWAFLVSLLLLTSSIVSIFHYIRVSDKDNGLPRLLPATLSGVRIEGDQLINERDSKYSIDPITLNEIIVLLSENGNTSEVLMPDSLIFINGKDDSVPSKESGIFLSFNRNSVLLKGKDRGYISFSYKYLTYGATVEFTEDSVAHYFKKRAFEVYVNLLLIHFLKFSFHFFSSVIFLAIAAFIFKRAIINNFFILFKLSLYASSVLAIENVVTAAAGYSPLITWYFAVFISIYAIFRGLNYIEKVKLESKKQINELLR